MKKVQLKAKIDGKWVTVCEATEEGVIGLGGFDTLLQESNNEDIDKLT